MPTTRRKIDHVTGERQQITLALRDPKWFEAGKSDYWEHAIAKAPFLRTDVDTQHQFAIYGGRFRTAPEVETFLANFLSSSGFNRP